MTQAEVAGFRRRDTAQSQRLSGDFSRVIRITTGVYLQLHWQSISLLRATPDDCAMTLARPEKAKDRLDERCCNQWPILGNRAGGASESISGDPAGQPPAQWCD